MGCDIHLCVEYKKDNDWYLLYIPYFKEPMPFTWRDYELFAFLGYAGRTHMAIPECDSYDVDMIEDKVSKGAWDYFYDWKDMAHNVRAVSVQELLNFDYDKKLVDPRLGNTFTLREIINEKYFKSLNVIEKLPWHASDLRILYWFDN